MRIFFILFLGVYLFGLQTEIVDINKDIITLNKNVKRGISGVVLCPYEGRKIICANCLSLGNQKAKLEIYDNLKNDAFALPVVYPKLKDEVIFGKDYNRVLIVALNQISYLKVKENLKGKVVIPVDTFAAFLDGLPTREDFIKFAKKMDIGVIVFVLDKVYFVDANSFYVVGEKNLNFNVKKFKLPFYSSYNFDIKEKNIINYYKKMLRGLND